jgi:hypothetical protein
VTDVTSLVLSGDDDITTTAEHLASRLGLTFEVHDSSFRGGDYLLAGEPTGEHFIVQRNEDGDEQAEDVADSTIVYVEATSRAKEVAEAAADAGLRLVRREDWSKP